MILVELYFYKNAYVRMPINWTKRWVVIMMIAIVAVILPAAQGHRSNPDVTPLPILSDWYFLGLYQMYKYLEPVVATEITMIIPISVVLCPFLDVWITGPEKDIMKRPFMLMVIIMGLISWVLFSLLIIANVANIHTDPPYWRLFTYGMVDVGVVWQILVFMREHNVATRLKHAAGCFTMGCVMAVQTLVGVIFYWQARSEMFADPLLHQFLYQLSRWAGADNLQKAEDLVRKLMTVNKEYWNYPVLLDPDHIKLVGEPAR